MEMLQFEALTITLDHTASRSKSTLLRKHGAFTLVNNLEVDLFASLALLESFPPNARSLTTDDEHKDPQRDERIIRTGKTAPAKRKPDTLAVSMDSATEVTLTPAALAFSDHRWDQRRNFALEQPLSCFGFFRRAPSKARRGLSRRAVFSDVQRQKLEDRFQVQKYIGKPDRKKLAEGLGLKDSQVLRVKVWFQNRRMKWRNCKERELMLAQAHYSTQERPSHEEDTVGDK